MTVTSICASSSKFGFDEKISMGNWIRKKEGFMCGLKLSKSSSIGGFWEGLGRSLFMCVVGHC